MTVEVVAVISDVHWPHVHVATWRAFRAWHRDVRPSRTVVLGDFFDLPMVSNHPPEPSQGIELLPPIKSGCHQLRELADECGHLDFVEGNHEGRVYKKLIQPLAYQLRGLEHLVSLEGLCRAHGLPDSVLWHVEDPPTPTLRVGQFVLRHGHHQSGRYGGGVAPARTLLLKEAHQDWSAIVGHYHRPQIHVQGDRVYAVNPHMEADVKYTGGIDGWCRGWSVLELDGDTERAHLKQFLSNDGRFVCDGRVYDGRAEGSTVGAAAAEVLQAGRHSARPDHQVRPRNEPKVVGDISQDFFHVRSLVCAMAAPATARLAAHQDVVRSPGDGSGIDKIRAQVEPLGHRHVDKPGVDATVPKHPAQGSVEQFHVRSFDRNGRRILRFTLPNQHGRWVPHDTAAVARWAGLGSSKASALIRNRVKAWEDRTGAPITDITWEEFQEDICGEKV